MWHGGADGGADGDADGGADDGAAAADRARAPAALLPPPPQTKEAAARVVPLSQLPLGQLPGPALAPAAAETWGDFTEPDSFFAKVATTDSTAEPHRASAKAPPSPVRFHEESRVGESPGERSYRLSVSQPPVALPPVLSSRAAAVTVGAAATTPPLPKAAELIKAEMGVVLGTRGRQVISVSLADDLPREVAAWCSLHGLPSAAQAKIEKELQSRLDAALAHAYAEAEAAAPSTAAATDVC